MAEGTIGPSKAKIMNPAKIHESGSTATAVDTDSLALGALLLRVKDLSCHSSHAPVHDRVMFC